jgi:uncharacterized protein (DUF4415 family)
MAKKQSASSPQEKLTRVSAADIIRHSKKPETIARLKKLAAKPDSEIAYSDIPALTDKQLEEMIPLREWYSMRLKKESVTVRLDKDVVTWLRSGGKRYQTRMNAILREAMQRETKQSTAR